MKTMYKLIKDIRTIKDNNNGGIYVIFQDNDSLRLLDPKQNVTSYMNYHYKIQLLEYFFNKIEQFSLTIGDIETCNLIFNNITDNLNIEKEVVLNNIYTKILSSYSRPNYNMKEILKDIKSIKIHLNAIYLERESVDNIQKQIRYI